MISNIVRVATLKLFITYSPSLLKELNGTYLGFDIKINMFKNFMTPLKELKMVKNLSLSLLASLP